jgi:hypothetical protein
MMLRADLECMDVQYFISLLLLEEVEEGSGLKP